MDTLRDNLARANFAPDAAELRAAASDTPSDGRTLFGYFSVFNSAYEVNSMWEGNFMETIAPGAFKRSISERGGQIKALYDHGHDPSIGNKPLGPFNELKEDSTGGYYEIGLIDTSYNDDLMPAARAGLLGASFRFSVRAESWVDEPKASKSNPRALPERTITDVDLFELGPVTFPASSAASASLRSTTDDFYQRALNDPLFLARLAERTSPRAVENLLTSLAAHGPSGARPDDATHGQSRDGDASDPLAWLTLARSSRG
jgi:HK97 family phage prohead protease